MAGGAGVGTSEWDCKYSRLNITLPTWTPCQRPLQTAFPKSAQISFSQGSESQRPGGEELKGPGSDGAQGCGDVCKEPGDQEQWLCWDLLEGPVSQSSGAMPGDRGYLIPKTACQDPIPLSIPGGLMLRPLLQEGSGQGRNGNERRGKFWSPELGVIPRGL